MDSLFGLSEFTRMAMATALGTSSCISSNFFGSSREPNMLIPVEPDTRQFCRLLRARRERPRGHRAAEQRYERAPVHLIT
jgi:hypothetical protein